MKSTDKYKVTEKDCTNNRIITESIAQLALRTDMSNQQKLQNIHGDHNWETRKNIIMIMIEKEMLNPDIINYLNWTPLEESVVFDDLPFATYLLQKNAQTLDISIAKKASPEMLLLLQKYTITILE